MTPSYPIIPATKYVGCLSRLCRARSYRLVVLGSAWPFANSTVEQDGPSATCTRVSGYKTARYRAWYEMYPGPEAVVFDVDPGDTITASVTYDASENYDLTVTDTTSGATDTEVATCSSCARASAEWIIERAAFCSSSQCTQADIAELPDFGTTTMSDDVASDGGPETGIKGFPGYIPIQGVYNLDDNEKVGSGGFESVDTVGRVTKANSFTATWDRSGEPTPVKL